MLQKLIGSFEEEYQLQYKNYDTLKILTSRI